MFYLNSGWLSADCSLLPPSVDLVSFRNKFVGLNMLYICIFQELDLLVSVKLCSMTSWIWTDDDVLTYKRSGFVWKKMANWYASWICDFSLDVKPCLSKYLIKPWTTLHHLMRSPRLLCDYVWVGIGDFSYICYIECWGTFDRS